MDMLPAFHHSSYKISIPEITYEMNVVVFLIFKQVWPFGYERTATRLSRTRLARSGRHV
jgi:hypothetical protein